MKRPFFGAGSQTSTSAAALALLLATACAMGEETIAQAVKRGEAHLVLRYRYENVEQQGFEENAQASTLLGRLNYRSASYQGFSLFAEVDTIQPIGAEQYNSAAGTSGPNRAQFPVVADPDGTEINQAYIQYAGWPDTTVSLGRIAVSYDNQRFVGGVAWRQNEQTYDGLLVTNTTVADTTLSYLFIDNINRIFGDDVNAGDHESSAHMLNLQRNFQDLGALTGYAYLIDNKDAPAFSTNTAGLRWTGTTTLVDSPLKYTLEFASQRDSNNNPVDFDTHYFTANADWDLSSVGLLAGVEILAGDAGSPGRAFRTPLATLHKFNGWADMFLATPHAGLEDLYVGIKGYLKGFSWQAHHHEFSAQDGGADFGSELNLVITTKIQKNYDLMLKYADFSADSGAFPDTRKFWVMLTAKF